MEIKEFQHKMFFPLGNYIKPSLKYCWLRVANTLDFEKGSASRSEKNLF